MVPCSKLWKELSYYIVVGAIVVVQMIPLGHVIILSLLITYRPVCVSQTDQSVCVKQTGLFDTNRPDRSVCVKQTGLFLSYRLVCLSQTDRSV